MTHKNQAISDITKTLYNWFHNKHNNYQETSHPYRIKELFYDVLYSLHTLKINTAVCKLHAINVHYNCDILKSEMVKIKNIS